MIAKWQLCGFIHGVMNTDNMTVSGETIDYGPCAFMDAYDPETVFSSIDTHGRYSYENQPKIAVWNLSRLAETLLPLFHQDEDVAVKLAQEEVTGFWSLYQNYWLTGMREKLGLSDKQSEDELLIKDLLKLMQAYGTDYTNTFRVLTLDKKDDMELFRQADFHTWYERWQSRLKRQAKSTEEIKSLMKSRNPAVIPRNHRVEDALNAAEQGDFSLMNKLLDVLKNPYGYTPDQEEYAAPPDASSCCYKTFCGT